MNRIDVIVVGGGAAGLVAAGVAAKQGAQVLLLERNHRMARCNITNNCSEESFLQHVCSNSKFLFGPIHRFPPQRTMAFLEEQGVPLKVERGNRVFPVSDKAVDIVDALVSFARNSGVHFMQKRVSKVLISDQRVRGVSCEDNTEFLSPKVIVATGGKSYSQTGSTGDGYQFALQAGHTIVSLRPSLIPIETREDWCRE